MTTFQDHYEACLKEEGLYSLFPEDRRDSVFDAIFNQQLALVWAVALWVGQAGLILYYTNYRSWLVALITAPAVLATMFVLVVGFYVVKELKAGIRDRKVPKVDINNSLVGVLFLLVFPLLLTAITGLYLQSSRAALFQAGVAPIAFGVMMLLESQQARIHGLFELLFSAVRVLSQSALQTVILLPVLLVIVLLSVFSDELWFAIGNLPTYRIVIGVILLGLPAALLVFASLNRTLKDIIKDSPEDVDQLLQLAQGLSVLGNKIKRGLISAEEWRDLRAEISWRDRNRAIESVIGPISRRAKHWLILLLASTTALMVIIFFVYFCVLFRTLLEPTVIATWVGRSSDKHDYTIHLLNYSFTVPWYSSDLPILKVSLILSAFVAVAANVHSLTDSTATERLTSWLREKVQSWLALGVIYDGILCPRYQIWQVIQRDRKRGVYNASIIVPTGVDDSEVRLACEHFESRLNKYQTLVHITAYEQNANNRIYESWGTGRRWQLLNNKANGHRSFEALLPGDDDVASNPFLGLESLDSKQEIPDTWFGNNPTAVSISRNIWQADLEHEWVLHPSAKVTENATYVRVSMTKRMQASSHYKDFLKRLLSSVISLQPEATNITIELAYRNTVTQLASVSWHVQVPNVTYSDELQGKTRYEDAGLWIGNDNAN